MTLGFPGPSDAVKAASCDTRRISPVLARDGIIGAQHPLVSSTGLRVLATGGNAVDAAVAAALVGTVVMPGRCGIGGDLFAIVASPDASAGNNGERLAFHGSGIAPRGASLEFMREQGEDAPDGRRVMAQRGPLSPSVPGFVDGCFALLERFGTRPFAELAAPAMAYAAEGFPISPAEANGIAANAELLASFPTSAAVFLADGAAPHSSQILRQTDLARSLSLIAGAGPGVFYRGEIAKSIASFLAANGGALTEEDFADHATAVSPPLTSSYRDHTIHETELPTQGFVVLEALNICEQAPIARMGLTSASAVHTEVSALGLAFADRRAYAGDPNYGDTPLATLLSKEWAAERYATIDPHYAASIDAGVITAGDTISLIFTVSASFGSGVVAGDTGILLTNRAGHCFELEDGHPNIYAPGKRTMHTLNCYLIADPDDTPILAGGTPGGDYQPQWNIQTITGLIDGGLDVQAAAEQPRWQFQPATYPIERGDAFSLTVEDRLGEETIAELEEMGYPITRAGMWGAGGSVQVIARDPETGILVGGSDPRAEGMAVGL